MKKWMFFIAILGLLILILLSILFKDLIHDYIIIPLAYLYYWMEIIYASIPQLILWLLLLPILIVTSISILLNWSSPNRKKAKSIKQAQGPLETLAGIIEKSSGKGNYYRWVIAHRLGGIWREMNEEMDIRISPASSQVLRYFKAGVEQSFTDYPLPKLPFFHREETPFDLNIEQAINFLESFLSNKKA